MPGERIKDSGEELEQRHPVDTNPYTHIPRGHGEDASFPLTCRMAIKLFSFKYKFSPSGRLESREQPDTKKSLIFAH